MTEEAPLSAEQLRQLNRSQMEKMLDKPAEDPECKQRLLDEPEAAMAEAGLPETRQLKEMHASLLKEQEVQGHIDSGMLSDPPRCVIQGFTLYM
jgi:hypothetical protein